MRISDWSSDVCSSDLSKGRKFGPPVLWARIAGPDGRAFMAATLHYTHPTSRAQAVQRRDVARALARINRDALIVAGDKNLTPWAAATGEQARDRKSQRLNSSHICASTIPPSS